MKLVVLGLGNVLCGDDGLGVDAVLDLAKRYAIPEDAAVFDGGTLGLSLIAYLTGARTAILVDAIAAEGPPGTLVRLEGEEVLSAARQRLSVHQIGVADLLDALRMLGDGPERIVLLGMVPGPMELDTNRSGPVAARIPALADAVAAEARSLGFPIRELH
jgi:hydrogenase maturation protease